MHSRISLFLASPLFETLGNFLHDGQTSWMWDVEGEMIKGLGEVGFERRVRCKEEEKVSGIVEGREEGVRCTANFKGTCPHMDPSLPQKVTCGHCSKSQRPRPGRAAPLLEIHEVHIVVSRSQLITLGES